MIAARRILPVLCLALLVGCATNGGLRRVETQVTVLRVETARRDSARGAELDRIIRIQERLLDSLASTAQALRSFRSATAADLTDITRQLVQIQELTGQSQQRLTQLRADLEARNNATFLTPPVTAADSAGEPPPVGGGAPASANQMYQAALMQFRRGSTGTARMGFHAYLAAWPNDLQVADALYFIGETFTTESPDSAVVYYTKVLQAHPTSTRAASALYKIGRAAEARNDLVAARAAYERLIREYPRADNEVSLARGRLTALRP